MRIYFIGAHSTGKTTLARYAATKYKLPFLNEVARTILAERELQVDTLRTNLDVVDDYQSAIFTRQLAEERKQIDFVSDRSLDCLAYTAQHATILSQLIHSQELKDYAEYLKKPDAFLFFVRPSKATLKADGVRESLSWDGVVAIDAMVKLLLEMWALPYIPIDTDSMQERARLIDSVISRYLGK